MNGSGVTSGVPPSTARPSRSPLWTLACPALVIAWRIASPPPGGIARDWLVFFAAYWIFTEFTFGKKGWGAGTIGVMIYLLSTYMIGQYDKVLTVLWPGP